MDLAKAFPDPTMRAAIINILKKKKWVSLWGDDQGRLRLVSFIFGALKAGLVGAYLTLIYLTDQFDTWESAIICSLAAISLINYIYAIYILPEYAQLPRNKSHEEFLNLLKSTMNNPDAKICAYCQIEKPQFGRHCFICRRCVLEHDCHCFMLNNCVGKDNRGFVIAYLFTTSLLLFWIVLSALFHFTDVLKDKNKDDYLKFTIFRVWIGITGSISLLVLIPIVYYVVKFCKSSRKYAKHQQKYKKKRQKIDTVEDMETNLEKNLLYVQQNEPENKAS